MENWVVVVVVVVVGGWFVVYLAARTNLWARAVTYIMWKRNMRQ